MNTWRFGKLSGYTMIAIVTGSILIFTVGCQPRTHEIPHWQEPQIPAEPDEDSADTSDDIELQEPPDMD